MILKNKEFIKGQSLSVYDRKVIDFLVEWETNDEFEVKTSGSTGEPKPITLKKEQILASILQTKNAFDLSKDTLFYCSLSIDYIAGKLQLLRAFELGANAIVVEPTANPFENLTTNELVILKEFAGNVFYAFVPLQLTEIAKNQPNFELLSLAKHTLIGGAGVSEKQMEIIKKVQTPVWATYGMTETVTHIAIKRLNGEHTDDFFTLLNGVDIDISPENCLKIKGKTTADFWIQTNDIVELKGNRQFKLIGRKDNVINSGGVKIQLEKVENEIEKILKNKVEFSRFFCFGMADDLLGQKLILLIETTEDIDSEIIKVELKRRLSKFEVPKEIISLKHFVNLPSGKINKIKTVNDYFSTFL